MDELNNSFEGSDYFRSLRPDEDISELKAKDVDRKVILKDQNARTESIMEHIRHGSKPEYKSPWLSLTADLDVALAFSGKSSFNQGPS